MTAKR
jgi:hypothetical protein